jgi:hypothetical protein
MLFCFFKAFYHSHSIISLCFPEQKKEKIHDEKDIEWANGAVGRCLIALGDLHRYLSLLAACSEFMAARFYTMVRNHCAFSENLISNSLIDKLGVLDGTWKQHAL